MNKVHSKGGSVHCGAIAVPEDEQKDNRIKNRCDEECKSGTVTLNHKSGESPAQMPRVVAQVGEMVVLIMQEIPRWQSVFYNFADTCSGRNGFFSFIGSTFL